MSQSSSDPGRKASPAGKALCALGAPHITVACLLWFAVLTVWGTLYQADPEHGLHGAAQRFFHSWFFLAGGVVPLPGVQGTSVVFLANLFASMLTRFGAPPRWTGLWIVHAGLVVLFLGGMMSRRYGRETTLVLAEGETSAMSVSETQWELAVMTPGKTGGRDVRAYDLRSLRPGLSLAIPGVSESVEVVRAIRSAAVSTGAGDTPSPDQVTESRAPSDPRSVRPAVVLRAGGGRSVLLGEGPAAGLTLDGGGEAHLHLRRARLPLPVSVRLLDFEKKFHPNSTIPRSYSSRVEVDAGGGAREVTISMNRPYRHGAFTFFQSSYMDNPHGPEVSVFAVSENHARLLPYAATVIMFAGMVVHYLPRRKRT